MIPPDHPRYRSLVARERIARYAGEGSSPSKARCPRPRRGIRLPHRGENDRERAPGGEDGGRLLLCARRPVISVNGNTAALAADEVARLQERARARVEVNLFHRSEERIRRITRLLEEAGVAVEKGEAERLLPLSHDRALCLRQGIYSADTVLVPLEDGDRCSALCSMGKTVIAIDLNPLSRTARAASLTIVDELTRALPHVTEACTSLSREEALRLCSSYDNRKFLSGALEEIEKRLAHALD